MGVNGARQTDIGELKANIASTLDNISAILGTDVGREELTLEEQVRNALRNFLAGGEEEEGEGGFNLMALLLGGGKDGLASKGGLGVLAGLLGGLTGQGEDNNPLEGLFASTYEKYQPRLKNPG